MLSSRLRIYRVLVPSVGGQGGGTISEVLYRAVTIERERVAESSGMLDKIAYRTDLEYRYMIPGLAQRNGSVYSAVIFVSPLELELPESDIVIAERFHTASVDVMIAQELAEAVRFAGQGLLKDDSTAIVNEHRFLTTVEKMPITKEHISMDEQIRVLKSLVGRYFGMNAHELALMNGMKPVYANTILLGALAASNTLPISKESYISAMEERFSGRVMDENIRAFEVGYKHVMDGDGRVMVGDDKHVADITEQSMDEILSRNYRRLLSKGRRDAERYLDLMARLKAGDAPSLIPDSILKVMGEGIGQLVEFEGWHHADLYVKNVMDILGIDKERGDGTFRLSKAYARHLAGRLMRWEGPFEVARIKSRKRVIDMLHTSSPSSSSSTSTMDAGYRKSIVRIEALLQPNVEEMYGMVPKQLHDLICRLIPSWKGYLESRRYDGRSISIDLTSVGGYLKLWLLWRLSFLHRYSVRYHREMELVEYFTSKVKDMVSIDYDLACMVADYAQYIRGFAHVRAKNIDAFKTLVEHVVRECMEMDKALANDDYRITKAVLRAAINLITLDGEGKEKVIGFMDEIRALFKAGEYDALYARLALRQFIPMER